MPENEAIAKKDARIFGKIWRNSNSPINCVSKVYKVFFCISFCLQEKKTHSKVTSNFLQYCCMTFSEFKAGTIKLAKDFKAGFKLSVVGLNGLKEPGS